ncbi:MAG: hypothetical protein NC250_03000, partial [Alistipes senegalensis]|nr:hypothetical protein [Alistipes senegalensis]
GRCRYGTWGLGLLSVGGWAAAGTAAAAGRWTIAAVLATVAVVAGAVLRVGQAVRRIAGRRCAMTDIPLRKNSGKIRRESSK